MQKNGPVEVNPYAQQQRYTSYYIPPVYSPQQQQFPLYSLITPQAWSTTHSFIDPTLVTTTSLHYFAPRSSDCLVVSTFDRCALPLFTRLLHFTTPSSSTDLPHPTVSNQRRLLSPSDTTQPETGLCPCGAGGRPKTVPNKKCISSRSLVYMSRSHFPLLSRIRRSLF